MESRTKKIKEEKLVGRVGKPTHAPLWHVGSKREIHGKWFVCTQLTPTQETKNVTYLKDTIHVGKGEHLTLEFDFAFKWVPDLT